MRVLVYEWCCATPARGDIPRAASLWAEGWAMLSAAVEDFRRVAGRASADDLSRRRGIMRRRWRAVAALAGRGGKYRWSDDEPAAFRAAAADADYALVIAPEFDRILETRCRWAEEAGADCSARRRTRLR